MVTILTKRKKARAETDKDIEIVKKAKEELIKLADKEDRDRKAAAKMAQKARQDGKETKFTCPKCGGKMYEIRELITEEYRLVGVRTVIDDAGIAREVEDYEHFYNAYDVCGSCGHLEISYKEYAYDGNGHRIERVTKIKGA